MSSNFSNARPGEDHLTDDQFLACALEASDAVAEAHLAGCEACRAELVTFQVSLQDFEKTTEAWSRAVVPPKLSGLVKERKRRAAWMQPAWALAAVVLLAVGVPVMEHVRAAKDSTQIAARAQSDAAQSDSAAQIAQDNQLMQNVYVALAPQDASPFDEYRVADTTHARAKVGSESRMP